MARERKGSVVDRGGKLYARVQFTDGNGKRRDLWRKVENRREARQVTRQLLKQVEESTPKQLDSANMTFAELAAHYITNYLQEAVYVGERKVSGVRGVSEALAEVKPLIAHFGRRKLRSLTYGDLRTYKQTRLSTPTQNDVARHKQALRTNPKAELHPTRSIAAVNKELGKLRRMMRIAVREQWISRSPFADGESLISLSDETKRERILSEQEEARIFTAIDAEPKREHLRGILLIALDCALRRGEIFKLRWSDVDLDRRTITVRAFNSKTARSRTVAMTSRVFNDLAARWQESPPDEDLLVFGVKVSIKTAFNKVCLKTGVLDFHFHDCRATAITRMIRAGMPPAEVMRVSGHTTLSCLYRYCRADENTIYRAASALEAYLAGNSVTVEATQSVN